MKPTKREQLEAEGWRVGSTDEFLDLSEQESIYIDLKIMLGESIKRHRQQKKMTQVQLAQYLKSNQSRIAKMEAGDPSVSLDLLVKSLLALGTTRSDLANIIAQTNQPAL